jgi:hypothetical protein
MANTKAPKLTTDEHLHKLKPEQVFRVHHGLNVETGEPLPGTEAESNGAGCACAHCVSHTEEDPKILADAVDVYNAAPAAKKAKK